MAHKDVSDLVDVEGLEGVLDLAGGEGCEEGLDIIENEEKLLVLKEPVGMLLKLVPKLILQQLLERQLLLVQKLQVDVVDRNILDDPPLAYNLPEVFHQASFPDPLIAKEQDIPLRFLHDGD